MGERAPKFAHFAYPIYTSPVWIIAFFIRRSYPKHVLCVKTEDFLFHSVPIYRRMRSKPLVGRARSFETTRCVSSPLCISSLRAYNRILLDIFKDLRNKTYARPLGSQLLWPPRNARVQRPAWRDFGGEIVAKKEIRNVDNSGNAIKKDV